MDEPIADDFGADWETAFRRNRRFGWDDGIRLHMSSCQGTVPSIAHEGTQYIPGRRRLHPEGWRDMRWTPQAASTQHRIATATSPRMERDA